MVGGLSIGQGGFKRSPIVAFQAAGSEMSVNGIVKFFVQAQRWQQKFVP